MLRTCGLAAIIAKKKNNNLKWISITNQRTKELFIDLKNHKAKNNSAF
jgi:hypothetical protein